MRCPKVCGLNGILMLSSVLIGAAAVKAQPLGEPDSGMPGDSMIQAYLQREASILAARFSDDLTSLEDWKSRRAEYYEQYMYMLGLSPRPDATPLAATITGTLEGDGYIVDMLHYQSLPGLYVTGNLYRPATIKPGERLPTVFYVCGHSDRGRDGNKVAYQSHGIWFARHGYVCLVVDTLQLGEIAAWHHGTYRMNRWWWHSRGYTPAGVEAWNGIRGIDYLISRPDVDPERIAVTGISGGGAATFWIAAADERVKVSVPVSGMADLESYVPNRVINGHCDCMFLYNTYQWPWTRIAGLVAPRPMLFVNSDQDRIFPMDANERVINRLERLYSLYGAGDQVDAVVSVGGHAYRSDIRQAVYRFLNTHLQHDPDPVIDSEADIVSEGSNPGRYPIAPERLRVFPTDADLPGDQRNTTIDEFFVPTAKVPAPADGEFDGWKSSLLKELRQFSFGSFPQSIPAATPVSEQTENQSPAILRLESESGIFMELRTIDGRSVIAADDSRPVQLIILNESEAGTSPDWIRHVVSDSERIVLCEPRGTGNTRWTNRNPPNYVQRSHALLGRTVDTGRVRDVIAAAKYLSAVPGTDSAGRRVSVAGRAAAGQIAACAAVLEERIAAVTVLDSPTSYMDDHAPQFLNILRVCDVPDVLGMLAPRPLRILQPTILQTAPGSVEPAAFSRTTAAYRAAGAIDQLKLK